MSRNKVILENHDLPFLLLISFFFLRVSKCIFFENISMRLSEVTGANLDRVLLSPVHIPREYVMCVSHNHGD